MAIVQQAPGTGVRRVALKSYQGANARHVAMPLGGVGAGQIAIGADGGLRQWQIFNQINHAAFVPHSFFAIRATTIEPPLDVVRILQSTGALDLPQGQTPLINDDFIPPDQRKLFEDMVADGHPRPDVLEDYTRVVPVNLATWATFFAVVILTDLLLLAVAYRTFERERAIALAA